jgi:molecular chaperone GrpE (heat shock protein)
VVTLFGIFGYGTLKLYIEMRIDEKIEKELAHSHSKLLEATIVADHSKKTLEKLDKQSDAIEEKHEQLNAQFEATKTWWETDPKNRSLFADRDRKQLIALVKDLGELVSEITPHTPDNQAAIAAYRDNLAKRLDKFEVETERFVGNAEYLVIVYFTGKNKALAENAVFKLEEAGFKATSQILTPTPVYIEDFDIGGAVGLGKEIRDWPKTNTLFLGHGAWDKTTEIQATLSEVLQTREIEVNKLKEGEMLPGAARSQAWLSLASPAGEYIAIYIVE